MVGSVSFFCISDTSDNAPHKDERLLRVLRTFE